MEAVLFSLIALAISIFSGIRKRKIAAEKNAQFPGNAADTREVPRAETVLSPRPASVPALSTAAAFPSPVPHAPIMGMEGADPCHEYMLNDSTAITAAPESDACMPPEEARQLVQGIILSEILARPQQRFAGRRK